MNFWIAMLLIVLAYWAGHAAASAKVREAEAHFKKLRGSAREAYRNAENNWRYYTCYRDAVQMFLQGYERDIAYTQATAEFEKVKLVEPTEDKSL